METTVSARSVYELLGLFALFSLSQMGCSSTAKFDPSTLPYEMLLDHNIKACEKAVEKYPNSDGQRLNLVAAYMAPIAPYMAPVAPYMAPVAPFMAPVAPYMARS